MGKTHDLFIVAGWDERPLSVERKMHAITCPNESVPGELCSETSNIGKWLY